MPHKKHYDWDQVQKDYDNELSYRDLSAKYGMTNQSIANAKKRGDLKTRTRSEAAKIKLKKYGPNRMGAAAKKRTSIRMSEHNPGGKSKWFEVNGIKVQGTWDRDFSMFLNSNNIVWSRPKHLEYIK